MAAMEFLRIQEKRNVSGIIEQRFKESWFIKTASYCGMKNIACLQVMHHGSRKNCHAKLARLIDPCFSIFSADPMGKYNPLLVEKQIIFRLYCDMDSFGITEWLKS